MVVPEGSCNNHVPLNRTSWSTGTFNLLQALPCVLQPRIGISPIVVKSLYLALAGGGSSNDESGEKCRQCPRQTLEIGRLAFLVADVSGLTE